MKISKVTWNDVEIENEDLHLQISDNHIDIVDSVNHKVYNFELKNLTIFNDTIGLLVYLKEGRGYTKVFLKITIKK